MLPFIYLLGGVLAGQLSQGELNTVVLKRKVDKPLPLNVLKNQFIEISNFTGLGYATYMSLKQEPLNSKLPHLCYPFYSLVTLHEYEKEIELFADESQVDLDKLTMEDIENFAGEHLTAMVHIRDGVFEIHQYNRFWLPLISMHKKTKKLLQSMKKISAHLTQYIKCMMYTSSFTQLPQLVYDQLHDYAFLIHKTSSFKIKLGKDLIENVFNQQKGWQNRNYTYYVRVAHGFLYAAVGTDGLDVYRILSNGDLEFIQNINGQHLYPDAKDTHVKILDIFLTGVTSQYLYVLDKLKGISQLHVEYSGDQQWKAIVNRELGLIPFTDGKSFEVYNNKTLIAIAEQNFYSYALEFMLLPNNRWFMMNKYHLSGRIRDVDISHEFAILTGIDTHIILRHSIHPEDINSNFKPTQSKFYAAGLQQLDFYTNSQGFDELIFGITTRGLALYDWDVMEPAIFCMTFQNGIEGQTFSYVATYNTTDCPEKQHLLQNQPEVLEPLVVCQTEETFKLKVIEPLLTEGDKEDIIYVIILIGLMFYNFIIIEFYH